MEPKERLAPMAAPSGPAELRTCEGEGRGSALASEATAIAGRGHEGGLSRGVDRCITESCNAFNHSGGSTGIRPCRRLFKTPA